MIYFPTNDPHQLLSKLKNAVDSGKIKSWTYDKDGDFTIITEFWNQKAWLHPNIEPGSLNFSIVRPQNSEISKAVYGVFHGRFIEVVLRYFDSDLTGNASASAYPNGPDDVG